MFYEGIEIGPESSPWLFDRVVLDLPEPWRVVPHAAKALRLGGVYLSYVPTVPQVMQTVQALEATNKFSMIHSFETLLRSWNVRGRSVRPDHRMVAHSGFITVARKVQRGVLIKPRHESGEDSRSLSKYVDGKEESIENEMN